MRMKKKNTIGVLFFLFSFMFFLAVSCAGIPAPADEPDDEIEKEEPQTVLEEVKEQAEEQAAEQVEEQVAEQTEEQPEEQIADIKEEPIEEIAGEVTVEADEEFTAELTDEVITGEEQTVEHVEAEPREIPEEPLLVIVEPNDKADTEIQRETSAVQTPPAPVPEPALTLVLAENIQDELVPEETGENETEEATAEEPEPPREDPRRNMPSGPAPRIESLTQTGRVPMNNEIIAHSRTVNAIVGQTIEIPFRGVGWVYLGEASSRRGIDYNSRRSDPEGQSFFFRAEEAGAYSLKFFRQDFIRDYIINDHVQVIVENSNSAGSDTVSGGWFQQLSDRGRVVAQPRWPSALNEAQLRSDESVHRNRAAAAPSAELTDTNKNKTGSGIPQQKEPSASTAGNAASQQLTQRQVPPQSALPERQSVVEQLAVEQPADAPAAAAVEVKTESAQSASPQETSGAQSADLLGGIATPHEAAQKAQKLFDDTDAAAAIALLDQFVKLYPSGSDEIYWLYGQFYEANSPSRNILLSLDYYRRLVREYPQSSRFADARRRIAYLERFYINIQ